ncbi:DUF2262 domain-containing protein [Rugamonas sp. DEMB1]|uniref:DUF2262 domain-containing protein n=1 Tax=Rugamonas sp. DEMB1 TaxID=3039386 RepID=UPI00244D18D0|nr:DUF2262 domain-containing protein [Rugamonas sp. DEMB1]WGG48125.1 DUF2262 domain-containing protein [Rugamonas sp. DEMB1]
MLNWLKKILDIRDPAALKLGLAESIEHTFLGALVPHPILKQRLVGYVMQDGLSVEIDIAPDDATMADALTLAELAVRSLSSIDAKSRIMLAADSLDAYNSDWRFGEIMRDDGSKKPFEKPLLSKDEFCANFQLKSIEALGKSTVTLWYSDSDMFWGHDFFVTSFDGLEFTDTHVSMAG